MTIKIKILTVTVAITLITALILFISAIKNKRENELPLTLKSYENHIALFKGEKLLEIYKESDITLLTDYDRFLLRNGIEIENEEHLRSILEDYDG